jgi:hypothetical protein
VRRLALAILVVAALAPGGQAEPAPPELVVIVNPANSTRPSGAELESMFLKKEKYWSGGDPVVALDASPDSDARREFDRVVLGMTPDASVRYWIDLRIRTGDTAPKTISDPALAVKLVGKLKGAIAYVPATTALTGVQVVGRIRRGKLVAP